MNFLGLGKDFLKSRKQVEKERKEFEKKIFPFEEEQKSMASALLKELLEPKLREEERMFAFIAAKDGYLSADEESERVPAALFVLKKQGWIKKAEHAYIVALIILELGIENLGDYPAKEDVLAKAKEIKEH